MDSGPTPDLCQYGNMVGRDFAEVFLEAFPPGRASFGFAACAFLLRLSFGDGLFGFRALYLVDWIWWLLLLLWWFCVFKALCTVCRQCFSPPSFAPVKLCPQHCLHTDLLVWRKTLHPVEFFRSRNEYRMILRLIICLPVFSNQASIRFCSPDVFRSHLSKASAMKLHITEFSGPPPPAT
jgi:hypothetical protein